MVLWLECALETPRVVLSPSAKDRGKNSSPEALGFLPIKSYDPPYCSVAKIASCKEGLDPETLEGWSPLFAEYDPPISLLFLFEIAGRIGTTSRVPPIPGWQRREVGKKKLSSKKPAFQSLESGPRAITRSNG